MTQTTAVIIGLAIGLILTLAGFFGPEDEGSLESIGLVVLGISLYCMYKTVTKA